MKAEHKQVLLHAIEDLDLLVTKIGISIDALFAGVLSAAESDDPFDGLQHAELKARLDVANTRLAEAASSAASWRQEADALRHAWKAENDLMQAQVGCLRGALEAIEEANRKRAWFLPRWLIDAALAKWTADTARIALDGRGILEAMTVRTEKEERRG